MCNYLLINIALISLQKFHYENSFNFLKFLIIYFFHKIITFGIVFEKLFLDIIKKDALS